ncbi:MAG: restriction endonuclease [Clostridia bacterium]|nr:restriction endonuclease [Clostridia bacterium]
MGRRLEVGWTVSQAGFWFSTYEDGIPVCTCDYFGRASLDPASADTVALQILEELVSEESARCHGDRVLVPHATIAHLPEEERAGLNLPGAFPFTIELRAVGIMSDRNFSYHYRFLNGDGTPFVNPRRRGAFLEITPNRTYLLVGDQYELLEAVDAFNSAVGESGGESSSQVVQRNLLAFSHIKGLSQRVGAELDTYLNQEQVVVPTKIRLELKRLEDDTLEIIPILCTDEPEEGPNGNAAGIRPVLDSTRTDNWVRILDRFSEVRDVYALPGGLRVVLGQEQKAALSQVKRYRRVSGKEKQAIIEAPQHFFDPGVVDLDGFSERVIEVGEYKPRVFPFLRPVREAWLPPETGIMLDDEPITIAPEDRQQICEQIEKAISDGVTEIEFKGKRIPANQDTLCALKDLEPIGNMFGEAKGSLASAKLPPTVLVIKDNYDEASLYAAGRPADGWAEVRPGSVGLPSGLREDVKLLEHQEQGLYWLERLWKQGAKGALLADDMGLGKTLQTLAFLLWVKELMTEGYLLPKPMLVVAPVVLLKNWAQEYRRFCEPVFPRFYELHGAGLQQFKNRELARDLNIRQEIDIRSKDQLEEIIARGRGLLLDYQRLQQADLVLTTYEAVRDYQFSLGQVDWSVMVLDEAQKIKTPTALVTCAAKAMKYDFGIALTGTPVENSLVDLWSIMDFVQPGHLGTLKEFGREYHNPLAQPNTNRMQLGRKLKAKIDGLLLRRLKEEKLPGLPEKRVQTYPIEMPPQQLKAYLDVINRARGSAFDSSGRSRNDLVFKVIAELRDVSLHPFLLYLNERAWAEYDDQEIIQASARLIKTMELLDLICHRGEKAIIYLGNRRMQRVLQRLIGRRFNLHPFIINGEVAGGKRQEAVDQFQREEGFNLIIMSPQASGVGLNVTAANHVIHLAREWNPAKEDQATDRVYRIGQRRPVYIHIPLAVHPAFDNEICQGTFDVKLDRLLEHKRLLSHSVLMPPALEEEELQKWGEDLLRDSLKVVEGAAAAEVSREPLGIKDLDVMTPQLFKVAVAGLYRRMGFEVEHTPAVKNLGADLVALAGIQGRESFLIRCQQTTSPYTPMGTKGVEEILGGLLAYRQKYSALLTPVVVTNATEYSETARRRAWDCKVQLITRERLEELLKRYPVYSADIMGS